MAEDQEEKQGFSIARLEQFQNFPKWQIALFDRIAALFLFLIILIVFGTLIGLLITFLDFGSDEAKITAESFNKILLGIGAVLAVPFLVWRTMIAQDQNKIAQENTHSTTMAKAVEQLGAMKEEKLDDVSVTKPNIEVRLGAIYLLEKLAREHEQLHWPIMEILCAYIRENCDKLNPPSVEIQIAYATMNFDEESEYLINNRQIDGPRVDIQAALIVIGRRSEQQRDWERKLRKKSHHKLNYRLDLNSCQLAKMTFRGLNFEYAIFDNCCFERSSFINVELNNAKMGDIHFEGGLIQDSNLSNTNLNWASFHGAKIERNIIDNTSFIASVMVGGSIDRDIINQSGIDFLDLRLANLIGRRATRFTGYSVKFSCSTIHLTEFYNSNFSDIDFSGANMARAKFYDSSFKGADLADALLDSSDLSSAQFLTTEMLESAWGNSETKLPDGIERPKNERWALSSAHDNARHARWQSKRQRLFENIKTALRYE